MGTNDKKSLFETVLAVDGPADLPTGMSRLNHLKSIRVEGEEAGPFLQTQFCSDVSALSAGQQQLGAYCNPKGRALTIYRLLRDDTGFHLVLPDDLAEMILKRLVLYRMRAQVDIQLDKEAHIIGYIGKFPDVPNLYRLDDVRAITVQSNGDDNWKHDTTDDLAVLPEEFWRLAAILSVEPQVYAPTTELFIPQQVNLDLIGGVSFKKGCYPGQEIIARIRYLGKIKQRMVSAKVLHATTDAVPGCPLFTHEKPEQRIGMVVDAVRFEQIIWLTAMVPVQPLETGQEIHLGSVDGPQLTILPSPYPVTIESSSKVGQESIIQ